jgi:hypothetical protein
MLFKINMKINTEGGVIEKKKRSILELEITELQFRLAVVVRNTVLLESFPLTAPILWSYGKHKVSKKEMELTSEEADKAAHYLKQTATYLMAITIIEALKNNFQDLKNNENKNIVAAYQISRLVRNAFAHSPIKPVWRIDKDCQQMEFTIQDVISLKTKELNEQPFNWRDYGGPLAIFKLSQYVRLQLLQ